MATKDETNEEQQLQRLHIRQRRALNNGLAAVLGTQASKTFKSFGFEDAVDLQIERIEGEGTHLRPNRLDRVDRIEAEVLQAVTLLKEVPVHQFLEPDEDEDVNTPP